MSSVRPDELPEVSGLSNTDIVVAETNPTDAGTRKVVQITSYNLLSGVTGSSVAATGSNIGAGSGLISGVVNSDIKVKSLLGGTNISITGDAQTLTIAATGDSSSASNIGAGSGLISGVSDSDIKVKSLLGGTNISITGDAQTLTIAATGDSSSASNIGAGSGLISGVSDSDIKVKSLLGGTNISITGDAQTLTIAATGDSSSASNIGAGSGLISGVSDSDIKVKSLLGGTNISITGDAQTLTIAATGDSSSASNIGAGSGLISGVSDSDIKVKSLLGGTNISITGDAQTLTIAATGDSSSASNIGAGSGLISGVSDSDIKVKSLLGGTNISITGDAQTLTISSTGSSSTTTPFSFFSSGENNAGIITRTYYQTPTPSTYLSGIDVDTATDVTLYLRWDGPDDSYMGSGSINGQAIPTGNITELGSYTRRFQGHLSGLNLAGTTFITGMANGYSSVISLTEAGAGPTPISVSIASITGATAKAGTNLGTTSLKGGDSINVYATFNTSDVTGIKVYDSGISDGIAYTSYSLTNTGDGNHTATIPITVTSSRTSSQGISVVAQNNFGTAGNDTSSSNTITLDQTYPVISASDPTSYDGRSDGLRSGEFTTFANTISNWSDGVDYIFYSGMTDDIAITSPSSFQNPKTVSYVQGIYNNSDNLRIFVSRTGNGATDTEDVKIKIANGPVITGITVDSTATSATAPNVVGSTEIKGGDVVNSYVYLSGNGVSIGNITLSVSNAGLSDGSQTTYTSYSSATMGDGSFRYLIPVDVTSSVGRDGAQGIRVTARNNYGTVSDSKDSDTDYGSTAVVNNSTYPSITISTISYPATQRGLKDAESATVSNSISNFDDVSYTSDNGDLTISNSTTYETSKNVSRNGGSYNINSNNFSITATKTSNGRVESSSSIVNIANTAAAFTVSNLASSIASVSGTTVSDNFTLVSDQVLYSIPSLSLDVSQHSPSSLTITSSGTGLSSNNYTLGVAESNTKGSFTFGVSGRNLAGKTTAVIGTNPNYVLSGFAERVITASPVSLGAGLARVGTTILGPSTVSLENISEGGAGPSGGTVYTYQSYADGIQLNNTYDVDNKFTVCTSGGLTNVTGNYVFNLDKLNRAANTSVANPAKFVISQP